MGKIHCDLSIADINLRIFSDRELPKQDNLKNFYTECDNADITYEAFLVPNPNGVIPEGATKIYDNSSVAVFVHDEAFYHRYFYSAEISVLRVDDERRIYLRSDKPELINIQRSLALETELIGFDGFFMHASLVDVGGKGIIFSAPSGVGKSTQASLWEKHRGAQILNGDKVIVRFVNGKWMAYGSPWAGSSGIYLNKSVELSAVVFLGQASENTVRRLEGARAFSELINGGIFPYWDKEKMDKACSLCHRALSDLPIFRLDCRPDVSAVEELERYI